MVSPADDAQEDEDEDEDEDEEDEDEEDASFAYGEMGIFLGEAPSWP